jgi:hypothetical protein
MARSNAGRGKRRTGRAGRSDEAERPDVARDGQIAFVRRGYMARGTLERSRPDWP